LTIAILFFSFARAEIASAIVEPVRSLIMSTFWVSNHSRAFAEATSGLPPTGILLFELCAVVLGPLAEELLYRGVLLPWLERFLSSRTALAISGAIFAAQHLAYGPGIAAVFVTGLVLGWARQRTGGLAAPLFIHTAYNGVAALIRVLRYGTG